MASLLLARVADLVKIFFLILWELLVALIRCIQPSTPKLLKNEVIVVTGGSNGIGREILLKLVQVERDLTLISWDIDEAANQAVIKELKSLGVRNAYAYTVDVSNHDQVIQAAAKVREDAGDVTMLFNNAGIGGPLGRCWETDLNHAKKLLDVNLVSHWYTIREFLPAMIRKGRGHIIPTCSISGFIWAPDLAHYVTSKHAVKGYYECLKEDLRTLGPDCNIKVSLVYPSWIATNLVSSLRLKDTALLPSPLDPSKLAETVVQGVLYNEEHIYFPRHMRLYHMTVSLFPPGVFRRMVDAMNFDPLGTRSKKEVSQQG